MTPLFSVLLPLFYIKIHRLTFSRIWPDMRVSLDAIDPLALFSIKSSTRNKAFVPAKVNLTTLTPSFMIFRSRWVRHLQGPLGTPKHKIKAKITFAIALEIWCFQSVRKKRTVNIFSEKRKPPLCISWSLPYSNTLRCNLDHCGRRPLATDLFVIHDAHMGGDIWVWHSLIFRHKWEEREKKKEVQQTKGSKFPPATRWGNNRELWPTGPCGRSVLRNRLFGINNDYLFIFYLIVDMIESECHGAGFLCSKNE